MNIKFENENRDENSSKSASLIEHFIGCDDYDYLCIISKALYPFSCKFSYH